MKRVLITGMSGTGKSSVIEELAARGHRAYDLDTPEWSRWIDADPADLLTPARGRTHNLSSRKSTSAATAEGRGPGCVVARAGMCCCSGESSTTTGRFCGHHRPLRPLRPAAAADRRCRARGRGAASDRDGRGEAHVR